MVHLNANAFKCNFSTPHLPLKRTPNQRPHAVFHGFGDLFYWKTQNVQFLGNLGPWIPQKTGFVNFITILETYFGLFDS